MASDNIFRDHALMEELIKLKQENPDAFADLILSMLQTHHELAIRDEAPPKDKLAALDLLLKNQEERENYESCGFIVHLKERIIDADKDKISSTQ